MGFTAKNDVTGDIIISKKTNKAYEEGWERIFNKKQTQLLNDITAGKELPEFEPILIEDNKGD